MSSSTKLPVTRIGKYQILQHIATGGMGTVYKARDTETNRIVALKVLAAELAGNPIIVERFHREAKHAQKLVHRNIVEFYESGQADDVHYLAMEHVVGVDLSEYIRRKTRIDPEEARRIIIQACKALSHAFAMGLTHRDIKPSNFLLANEGGRCRVKLTDLGLSRMQNEEEFRVTRAGTTVGTVDYMAPEQARDASLADVRSDIYSLGCTLYHMLAGKPPFAEGGIGERVYKHLAAEPPDIREINPEVSSSLWTVMRRMLAKHPDDRFQTPDELLEVLRSLANDPLGEVPPVGDTSPSPSSDLPEMPPPSPPDLPTTPAPSSPPVLPAARPPAERPRRKTTVPEMKTVSDPAPDPFGITADQRQAANAQYLHATEVLRTGGDLTYAHQLLLSCVKLDPINLLFRKMLREVGRDLAKKKSWWFSSLTSLPAKGRLNAARRAGEHRKVLELGEEVLAQVPGDIATQMTMAQSAEELGLNALAIWMLEEARQGSPKDLSVLRALAELYERNKRFKEAIEALERVRALDPNDLEVASKIKDLAATETIARSTNRR